MKVGPKSSLRPFLHRALQLFSSIEVNSGRIFADMQSMEVNILKATIHRDCISIYKLGDNTTHSRKVSKNFQFDHFVIYPNVPTVMGMCSKLAASFPCTKETCGVHKDGGYANEL